MEFPGSFGLDSSFGSGTAADLLLAFLGGLATSFTPCVYPLIPVTLALFGAHARAGRLRSFLLSVTYVLGIAFSYSLLGMFSAYTGVLFGQLLGNPWVVATICFFLLLLSLYTLEVFSLDIMYSLQTRASKVGGSGFGGAFAMGMASGLVAAPCAAPMLIAILGLAASTKNLVYGGALLFTYALGFGVIFVILGTFSGLVRKLPKSGNWLHYVKFFIAAALLMVALFLMQPFVRRAGFLFNGMEHVAVLIVFGVLALSIASLGYRRNMKSLKVLSALVFSFCAFHLLIPSVPAGYGGLTWLSSINQGKAIAASQNRYLMVDFFAEWCAACKEFEAVTFPSPEVSPRLSQFVLVRVDLTSMSEENEKIQEDYSLVGLPSLLFFNPSGSEISDARVEGFKSPAEFAQHLDRVSLK